MCKLPDRRRLPGFAHGDADTHAGRGRLGIYALNFACTVIPENLYRELLCNVLGRLHRHHDLARLARRRAAFGLMRGEPLSHARKYGADEVHRNARLDELAHRLAGLLFQLERACDEGTHGSDFRLTWESPPMT